MGSINQDRDGFGTIGLIVVSIILALTVTGAWMAYRRINNSPKNTTDYTSSNTSDNSGNELPNQDLSKGWKEVSSIGGAYTIRIPDGWELNNYPGGVLNGDDITFSKGEPAAVTDISTAYAGDQKKFNVGFTNNRSSEDSPPQWQSPSQIGTEVTADFSIGSVAGKKYSIEYTQTVTGVEKGDKVYQYVFDLPNDNGLGVVYIQKAGDLDNLEVVEQAIKTIIIK